MIHFDVEAVRSQIRAMDFVRGTPNEAARWREADADARANNEIEGHAYTENETAFFKMLRDESVPPELATQVLLRLMDHPDADLSLPFTPMVAAV